MAPWDAEAHNLEITALGSLFHCVCTVTSKLYVINTLFPAIRCHVVWYIGISILEEPAVAPPHPLLSEAFKGRSYEQLMYGMKPSLDKELYPPFGAVKLCERLLQRFLRLLHGMQGVRKQIAFLLRAVVLTKVPASLCQLCKTQH